MVTSAAQHLGAAPGGARPSSAEQRVRELGLTLPPAVEPLGSYAEAVQTGNLFFLSGVLPRVAEAASELLQDVFGRERNPCRSVFGVASLPLGVPVELEVIF